jgi:hypothetical protein
MTEQDVFISNKGSGIIASMTPQKLIISNLVEIDMKDGSLKFLEGYTPEKAARVFWEALSEDYRKMLRWRAEHGDAM